MRIISKSHRVTHAYFRWVREFLNEENKGLEVLIEYLSFQLEILK